MRTNIKKMIAVLVTLTAFFNTGNAQVNKAAAPSPIEVMANYIFTQDSVAGFDEKAASAGALANACYGREFNVFMYKAKRTYVKQKYNLKSPAPDTQVTLFNNAVSSRAAMLPGGACNNEDFELAGANILAPAAVQGWSFTSGTNNNSCQPPQLNLGANLYTVFTTPVIDPRMPTPVTSYFDAGTNTTPAGNSFIRLNDDQAGAKAVRMSKSFIPTPTSALFQYAYIALIEDGTHACCNQAGFNIKVTVTNTVTNTSTLLTCPNISVAVPGAACSFTIPAGGPVFQQAVGGTNPLQWKYANWTASAIDLTQYINSQVTIDITVVDCDAGGHGAYFYFDSKCSAMSITGNGSPFPAGTPSVTLPTCGSTGATICATPGLGPYSWDGPGVVPPYNTPSMSNQCFTSSLSATYTLYMNPPGSCAPIARVINTTITPAPLLLASIVQATCGGSLAVITITPSGSAANPSSINWSPTPLMLTTQTTVATYTVPPLSNTNVVSVTASDPLGCLITQTLAVLPPPPNPSFTITNVSASPSITCRTPSVDLNGITTYTYGTLNYFWSNNTATFATNPVNITLPGTYTAIVTDPVTLCQTSRTITIGLNQTAPSSSVSPNLQSIICQGPVITVTANANPVVNITHMVISPYGGTTTATSHTMIYVPSVGVYTHVLVNDVTGCTTTKEFTVTSNQVFPIFQVQSPQNFTLGCGTTSCAVVNIVGASGGGGGAASYTILTPANPNVSPTGSLSGPSTYNFCNAGTYTVVVRDNVSFCDTKVPISILENDLSPNIDAIYPQNILDCNTPSITLQGLSNTPNVSYSWKFAVGVPNISQGNTITAVVQSTNTTQTVANTFTLMVTDNNNTCVSTSVIPIYQNLFAPKASAVGATPLTSTISCKVLSQVLTNQSSTGIPASAGFPTVAPVVGYLWEGPSPQEPLSNSTTYLGLTVGVYTLTAKDLNNGCTTKATHTIVDQRVYPDLSQTNKVDTLYCGVTSTLITVKVVGSTTGMTYSWTPPIGIPTGTNTNASYQVGTPGEYRARVTNTINGCVSSVLKEVVNTSLTAEFTPDNVSGFAPLTVNFTNNSSSGNNINIQSIWNFGNGSADTLTALQVASTVYNQAGTYTVTLFASKGACLETKQRVITVDIPSSMTIPNVFTPNEDGVNDFFIIHAKNLSEINATVFDRWGHVIYEVKSATGNILWDGNNQYGKKVAEGVYFYVIKAKGADGSDYNKKGTVSLYR